MNFRPWTPAVATLAALAIALPLLHGCGGGSSSDGPGYVRLVNATTDYSALDLYSTTTSISSSVASFGAGDYVSLGEGSYTFNLKSAGTNTISSTSTRSVSKDVHNTLLAYMSAGVLTTAYLTDTEAAPTSGAAKLRVFNTATAEAGNLDIYVVTSACTNLASAAATASNVSTWSTYDEITAASAGTAYHLCVTAAGDKSDLRLDIPSLTLTDQQIVTLVLTRSSGGVLVHGLLLNQQGAASAAMNSSVRMRVAADATASGLVTAVVNGTTIGASVTSPAVGGYKLVNAGDLGLALQINGTAVPVSGLTGNAGADLTLLVAGSAGAPAVALIDDDNRASTSSTFPTKLRLVNGLNGIGGGITLTDDYSVVADGVLFGTASSAANVASSAALARLETTFSGTSLNLLTGVTLSSGRVYTMFLLGDAGSPIGILRLDR